MMAYLDRDGVETLWCEQAAQSCRKRRDLRNAVILADHHILRALYGVLDNVRAGTPESAVGKYKISSFPRDRRAEKYTGRVAARGRTCPEQDAREYQARPSLHEEPFRLQAFVFFPPPYGM